MTFDESRPLASWVIGRADDCNLRVADSSVSSHHCRVTHQASGFTVEDLGSTNGTFVDGLRIASGEPVWVPYGANVILGTQVEMPWPVAPQTRPAESPSDGGKTITIGRSPESDVQIDFPIVSWNHAVIRVENGQYILEDRNSRNGTSIGELGNRIQRAVLDPSDEIYFGSYKISASQLITSEKTVKIGEGSFDKVAFSHDRMVIGRDPKCDIPLEFPTVSWRHAALTRMPNGILVEDLGSRNGTYVDGVRVVGKVMARTCQEIGLGSFRFQLLEDGELAQRDYNGKVTVEARDIVVKAPNGRRLLDPVSLTVFPFELVAVMGPAGAGKTTLLKALNGYTRPAQGTVLFRGQSLYDYYDLYRHMMGYVPQDDIVHPQLTVRQALYFSARLRTDLTDGEIDARSVKVLEDLGIPDKIDTIIGSPERKTLSGGQRKRVNIALELITDTPVLFLDEPTSGLSSYDAEAVIDLLKGMSKTGKTILTTIHQPSLKVYKQFDDLLMVSRDKGEKPGAMVYFGPAYPDSIQFFNPETVAEKNGGAHQDLSPEMLFSGMNTVDEATRTATWRQRYEESRYRQDFVTDRSGKQQAPASKGGEQKPRRQFGFKQWVALVKRNVIVKLQDRTQTFILLAQAPFFALLVALVIGRLKPDHFEELSQKLPIIHFLMVVAAVWFGCNNAARDIVGEWIIYKRERMVTLKLLPYVFSKLTVLIALCLFQCGSMLAIVYAICGLRSDFFSDYFVLLIVSLVGVGVGLCVSAISKTNEAAIALLPVVLLPIIALGGGMRPTYLMPKPTQILSLAIPSRWAFEANLLNEVGKEKWGASRPMPDYSCNIEPEKPPASSEPQILTASQPYNPSLGIQGDMAENSIPNYLISFDDVNGSAHTCRALADEAYPPANPTAHAARNRPSFRDSLAVLAGMLFFFVAVVIGVLRVRDSDPQ